MKTIKLILLALLTFVAGGAMAQSTVLINGTKVEGATSLADAITKAGITDSSLVTSVHYTAGAFTGSYDASNTTAFTGDGDWLTLRSLTNIDTLITDAGVTVSDMPAFELYDPHTHALATKTYYFCRKLTLLQMAELKSVGSYAFTSNLLEESGDRSLKSVDLANADSIGSYAFSNCSTLTDISLPAVETIENGTFSSCTSLKTVSLPTLKTMGEWSFSDCSSIQTTSLPKAVTIGKYAFVNCSNITIDDAALASAESIGDSAFFGCNAIKTLNLPKAVTIGNYAFSGISIPELTTAMIPNMKSLGDGVFSSCRYLESIDLSEVDSLGSAFSGCDALSKASLPKVQKIKGSFANCFSLEKIELPLVETIGNWAFNGCEQLNSVSCPKATDVGQEAFAGTGSLSGLSLPLVKIIGQGAFKQSLISSISLPAVEEVGYEAFEECNSLTEVSLPKATTIRSYAFSAMKGSLYSLTLPAAELIEDQVFCNSSFKHIILPSAKKLDRSPFLYCYDLSSVSLPAVPPETSNIISGTDSLCLIVVDSESKLLTGDAYTSAVAAYKSDAGYDATTGKWRGMILTADNNPTAVEMPEVNGAVWSGEGCIYVRTDQQTALTVYNIGGQIVKNTVVSSGTSTVSGLTPGIYVVRFGNSKSIKMYVK